MFRDGGEKNALTWNALTTSYDIVGLCDYTFDVRTWMEQDGVWFYLMSCYKVTSANYCKPGVVV